MPTSRLQTEINADINVCFDLARSIDLHKISTSQTNETAIAGKTSGLITLGETVTWRGKHFGIFQTLSSKITEFNPPYHFRDEQLKGAFAFFKHDHKFEKRGNIVIMNDIFEFQSPFGIFGRLFSALVLKKYMTNFLNERNQIIKEYAESNKWKAILEFNRKPLA